MDISKQASLHLIKAAEITPHQRCLDLIVQYLNPLYRTSLRLTGNKTNAEDLLQESLLKVIKNFEQLQDHSKIRSWLFRILLNTFYNSLKQRKKEPPLVDLELTDELVGFSPQESQYNPLEVFNQLFSDEVEDALRSLRMEFKTAIILFDVEGLTYDEIAEICQCSKGTVASRLYRAREILRSKLEEYAKQHGYL